MKTVIEWKVVPRTTYEITRTHQSDSDGGLETFGTFQSEETANQVMNALKEGDEESSSE